MPKVDNIPTAERPMPYSPDVESLAAAGNKIADQHGGTDNKNRQHSGQHPQGKAADNNGGGAGLAEAPDKLFRGPVCV